MIKYASLRLKAGELMVYFKDCKIAKNRRRLYIIQTENKDTVLKVCSSNDSFNLKDEKE
jgi:ribosomal protein L36